MGENSLTQYKNKALHLHNIVEETKREKEEYLRKIQEEWNHAQLSFECEKKEWDKERDGLEIQYHDEVNSKIKEVTINFEKVSYQQKIKITALEKDLEDISLKKKECEKSIQLLTEKLEEKDLIIKELELSRDVSIKESIEHEKSQFRI